MNNNQVIYEAMRLIDDLSHGPLGPNEFTSTRMGVTELFRRNPDAVSEAVQVQVFGAIANLQTLANRLRSHHAVAAICMSFEALLSGDAEAAALKVKEAQSNHPLLADPDTTGHVRAVSEGILRLLDGKKQSAMLTSMIRQVLTSVDQIKDSVSRLQ